MKQRSLETFDALARNDERIVFIGSDLGTKTLRAFRNDFPERFFMEGISEQHLVGMAAGLAMDGFIPFVSTFSTFFSRRALEQIAIDVCLHRLPVRFFALGGGLANAHLGPTHCATDDVALMRALPNMTVLVPADADECELLVKSTPDVSGPVYMRLTSGGDEILAGGTPAPIGKARTVADAENPDVMILSCGAITQQVITAVSLLAERSITARVVHFHTVSSLDADVFDSVRSLRLVVTAEEHNLAGGFGSAVLEALADRPGPLPPVLRLGLPHEFVEGYGDRGYLLSKYGLDASGISGAIRKRLAEHN